MSRGRSQVASCLTTTLSDVLTRAAISGVLLPGHDYFMFPINACTVSLTFFIRLLMILKYLLWLSMYN